MSLDQAITHKEKIAAGLEEMFVGIVKSAKNRFKSQHVEIKGEIEAFKNKALQDIEIYSQKLIDGELSQSQYKELMADNFLLLQMKGLTQLGIAAIELDKFRAYVLRKILNFTFKVVLPAILKHPPLQ